jgi:hypothetical protein
VSSLSSSGFYIGVIAIGYTAESAMTSRLTSAVAILGLVVASLVFAQQPAEEVVRPIAPPAAGLPPESESVGVSKFSFIAYGDTRGQIDGQELQVGHGQVVDGVLVAIKTQAAAGFPVRFVVQSGDAVTNGSFPAQWNLRFRSLIERLTLEGGVPYFFAVGNHDLGGSPVGSPERNLRLAYTSAAMSKLWPPEGSTRRLDAYPTFAFGYGRFFFIVLDSNIPNDVTQLNWVTRQLEDLDRTRFPYVVAVFHHPPITSGPHGGPTLVEPQTAAIRRLYLPLFRTHHVRMTISGHDHLHDHYVEHYEDETGTHRMDHLITGGGGAPIYTYRGEPDTELYMANTRVVRVQHLARPGPAAADNPHHFMIIDVDGDRLWAQAVGTGPTPFRPYGTPRIELTDRAN